MTPAHEIPADVAKRFWKKVQKTGECWEWTGVQNGRGYGVFYYDRSNRVAKAHRVSYMWANGIKDMPSDTHVMHSCDNRCCVNPAHLSAGSHTDNMRDMASKGRVCTVGKSNFTHCPEGHPYDGDNLYINRAGHRCCRECTRVRQRARYLARNQSIVPRGARITGAKH